MRGNYSKNSDYNYSNDSIFNVSGQNIMSNNRSIDVILNENKKLKLEISRKNREIEDAKKRLNIIEREIEKYRKQKNNDYKRGRSVGIRNNTNINNNYNNFNNYNNNINGFIGGMFNENDPFNDSFFQFPD